MVVVCKRSHAGQCENGFTKVFFINGILDKSGLNALESTYAIKLEIQARLNELGVSQDCLKYALAFNRGVNVVADLIESGTQIGETPETLGDMLAGTISPSAQLINAFRLLFPNYHTKAEQQDISAHLEL